MYHLPEQHRNRHIERNLLGVGEIEPGHGAFYIPSDHAPKTKLLCIASDGLNWEHVSISARHNKRIRLPTWEEMCQVKDLFWDDEDVVVQYHPKKSEYVNNAQALHLWRPIDQVLPAPPAIMVGIKDVGKMTPTDAIETMRILNRI